MGWPARLLSVFLFVHPLTAGRDTCETKRSDTGTLEEKQGSYLLWVAGVSVCVCVPGDERGGGVVVACSHPNSAGVHSVH